MSRPTYVWLSGCYDQQRGIHVDCNPYRDDPEKSKEWIDGWNWSNDNQ